MAQNKVKRARLMELAPHVSVEGGKVLIEIGGESKAFEPTYLGGELAAEFLSKVDVAESGVTCSSSVDFPTFGGLRGVNIHEWLSVALERSAVIRGLRERGIQFPTPAGELGG